MTGPWAAFMSKTPRGTLQLRSPTVGWWLQGPALGAELPPGGALGWLEVLGRTRPLLAPAEAGGTVVKRLSAGRARAPAGYGTVLVEVDPRSVQPGSGLFEEAGPAEFAETALVFRAPMSGRVYRRQGPDQSPFVQPGDVIEFGRTVCLLEVMKTFNRVVYGGPGLPGKARVVRVVVDDGVDVSSQDPILELEAL